MLFLRGSVLLCVALLLAGCGRIQISTRPADTAAPVIRVGQTDISPSDADAPFTEVQPTKLTLPMVDLSKATLEARYPLPADTRFTVMVYEGAVAHGSVQHHVMVLGASGAGKYAGVLRHQVPGSPVQTIMFRARNDWYVVGRVDDSLREQIQGVYWQREKHASEWPDKATVSAPINAKRIWMLKLPGDQATPPWNKLAWLGISSVEAKERQERGEQPSAAAWEHEFIPALLLNPFIDNFTALQ